MGYIAKITFLKMNLMLKQNVNNFIVSTPSRNTERVDAEQVTYWRICATLDKAESEFFRNNRSVSGEIVKN